MRRPWGRYADGENRPSDREVSLSASLRWAGNGLSASPNSRERSCLGLGEDATGWSSSRKNDGATRIDTGWVLRDPGAELADPT